MRTRIAGPLGIGWMRDAIEVQIIGSVIPGSRRSSLTHLTNRRG